MAPGEIIDADEEQQRRLEEEIVRVNLDVSRFEAEEKKYLAARDAQKREAEALRRAPLDLVRAQRTANRLQAIAMLAANGVPPAFKDYVRKIANGEEF
jgi:UDP-N-acetylmuramoylalanine-D-glutamate ligase